MAGCADKSSRGEPVTAGGNADATAGEAAPRLPDPGEGSKTGIRLKLFNKVMEKSLSSFIDQASFQRFVSTFHPFYKKNPQVMEHIHKQFIVDLQRTIQEDIDKLIEEGRLQCKLDTLDKLESDAKSSGEPAWRPCGVPEQDLCSFVMPYYQKQEVYLRQQLKRIKAENAALARRVQSGRDDIAHTEQHIATAVEKWKESAREHARLTSDLCPRDVFDVTSPPKSF